MRRFYKSIFESLTLVSYEFFPRDFNYALSNSIAAFFTVSTSGIFMETLSRLIGTITWNSIQYG